MKRPATTSSPTRPSKKARVGAAANPPPSRQRSPRELEQHDTLPDDVARFVVDALAHLPADTTHVVDLGCGDGKIGAAMKAARPALVVRGVEIDDRRIGTSPPIPIVHASAEKVTPALLAKLGNPPPETTAIVGNFPFRRIAYFHEAWAGHAAISTSMEPEPTSAALVEKPAREGWMETGREPLGKLEFLFRGKRQKVGKVLWIVTRSHPGLVAVAAKHGSAALPPDIMVKRWGMIGATTTDPVEIQEKWDEMVTEGRGREQSSDYFFFVRFGGFGIHLQRLTDATPRLQAQSPGSTQSSVPLVDVWRAYHDVLPPPPLAGPGSLDLLESAPNPDALCQEIDGHFRTTLQLRATALNAHATTGQRSRIGNF